MKIPAIQFRIFRAAWCVSLLLLLTFSVAIGDEFERLTELNRSLTALANQATPAVVGIIATGYVPADGDYWSSHGLISRQQSGGSGVILSHDGYIVTNAHVVEGAQRIQVILAPSAVGLDTGRSIVKPRGKIVGAQLAGIDAETDLAVLKIQEQGLPALRLGNSDDLRQGELVLALGAPRGLENSVSMGVVSAVARQLRPESPMIYIQTDAPINPGNSGGPLINTEGEVVGINSAILSSSGGAEGIGFAAPSNIVRNVFNQIKERGYVRRGEIGVNAQTLTPIMADGLGISVNYGVVLADVYPGSPAEEAGLVIGDVVLDLDGKPMENGRQFDVNLYGKADGAVVELRILRGDDTTSLPVAVREREEYQDQLLTMVTPERNLVPKLGILGLDLNNELASILGGTREGAGVVVAARSRNAPMWEENLHPGDVVYALNNSPVESLDELRSILESINSGSVVLHVERRGKLYFIPMEIH